MDQSKKGIFGSIPITLVEFQTLESVFTIAPNKEVIEVLVPLLVAIFRTGIMEYSLANLLVLLKYLSI